MRAIARLAVVALACLASGSTSGAGAPLQTLITVGTTSDEANGDASSVERLITSPGPDGISLREAIEATNNDPGSYTIAFAPVLRGRTITLDSDLPPLTGGGVTVEGDIDGDGKPDVTLRTGARHGVLLCPVGTCVQISSSGNRLHALTLEGFTVGVLIQPRNREGGLPTNMMLADNVVSGLVMRGISSSGIEVVSRGDTTCGVFSSKPQPCRSFNRWVNTTLTDNTIEAGRAGIDFALTNSGDRIERATVTGNTIRIVGSKNTHAGIGLGIGGDAGDDSSPARISDVLIARNSIAGSPGIGITVGAGAQRAQAGVTEGVRILDNRLQLVNRGYSGFCCQGIVVMAGSDASWTISPDVLPLRYPDDNVTRNIQVNGNSVSGTLHWGVQVQAGIGAGGSRNRVENVQMKRNVIRSSTVARGVLVVMGDGDPVNHRYATGNRIAGFSIDANRITIGNAGPQGKREDQRASGIVLVGGGGYGRDGRMRDVQITNNRIATTKVGIKLIGGFGPTARGNSVMCVRLAGNRVTGARKAVSVHPNVDGASGNRASLGDC